MSELSAEEFRWNLKRLLREGFPQGIPVGDLSATYSYWLRTTSVEPNSIIPGCQNWEIVFEVNVLLKETFLISTDTIPYVKIRSTNEESEDELTEVLEMVKYSKRAQRESPHENADETVPAEITTIVNSGTLNGESRESKEKQDKKPSTSTNNKKPTKSTKYSEKEVKKATEKKYSPLLDDNENSSKSRDSLSFSDDDMDQSLETERTSTVGKSSIVNVQQSNDYDSDEELPSSTIRTHDFTESSWPFQPILETTLVMPDMGQFNATIFNVSHNHVEGVVFPETPVSIVGRISHDNVWDYIAKMNKNKELLIFRLAPASSADIEPYMAIFNYLTARRRFGVLGGIRPPVKDVYLIPQHKSSPLNNKLLPINGPGLPKDRSHSLLAVVTRRKIEPPAKTKRQCVPTGEDIPFKMPKSGAVRKLKNVIASVPQKSVDCVDAPNIPSLQTDETPYIPSAMGSYGYTTTKDETTKTDEDLKSAIDGKKKTQAELLMEELNARIQQEKQEIESMTAAISNNGHANAAGTSGSAVHFGLDDGEYLDASEDTSVLEYIP